MQKDDGVQRDSTVPQTVAGKLLGGRGAQKPVFGVPWECENTGFKSEKSFLQQILTLKKVKIDLRHFKRPLLLKKSKIFIEIRALFRTSTFAFYKKK